MRTVCLLVFLIPMFCYTLFADTQDTVVFRTAMRTDAEVPPVTSPGTSGSATITVNVTRDGRGNIDSASVTFEVDYTVAAATTFTGLHIHNAPAGSSAGVVIDTGITAAAPFVAAAGSGRITKVVNYTSADTTGLRYVTGLLAQPELYYVNIHSTTNLSGLMRGQLLRTYLRFRPVMSSQFEVPAVNLDAEGAALVEVRVNRDNTGAITSGVVTFDVDYRFPSAVTITGLHIHNGPAGATAGVVIDSGVNSTTRSISNVTRGNIFRVTEINPTDSVGIAALNGLMNDPTQYYINMHTSANQGGVIRGQLSPNVFVFFNQMTSAEEVPPTNTSATANSMTYVRLDRDPTGNVISGAVSFNLNFNMGGGPVTFTGLHIHNGKFGVSAGVVIDTQITAANPVVDDDGIGSINREVVINSSSTAAAFDSLRGLVENPENYYVNIHTSTNLSGIIRAQLARETYHFRAAMSAANEFPPISSTATATGWITARIARDDKGVINGGTVVFDVNHVVSGQTTFTGLHIHYPGAAGTTGPVRINTGIGGTTPAVDSPTGIDNITRTVTVPSTDTDALATLNALINAPDQAYVNLHTLTNGSGLMRSQMLPISAAVAEAAGGGGWITSVQITNPSSTASVYGIVNFLQSNGTAMPEAVTDANRSFWIPAGGSTTLSLNNKAPLTTGFAKVFSNTPVTISAGYQYPTYPAIAQATTVRARSVSIPVNVTTAGTNNTGIALLAETAGNIVLTLSDSTGAPIAGGSVSIPVTAGQHIAGFVKELLPSVASTTFTGNLTVTANATAGTGSMSVVALQFGAVLSPVTITTLP